MGSHNAEKKDELSEQNKAWVNYTLKYSYNEGLEVRAKLFGILVLSSPLGTSCGQSSIVEDWNVGSNNDLGEFMIMGRRISHNLGLRLQ
jgi:hypothetical protein